MLKILPNLNYKQIQYVAVHHFGGSAGEPYGTSQWAELKHVEAAHARRWPDFVSRLGYHVGYTAVILRGGDIHQTRLVGEETAAVIGHNHDTVSLALAGNFSRRPDGTDVEVPTFKQIAALTFLLRWLHDEFGVMPFRVGPHRMLWPTACYGSALGDDWARALLQSYIDKKITAIQRLLALYLQLVDLLRKKQKPLAGTGDYDCCGFLPMTLEELKKV